MDATQAPAVGGVDAAIPAWAAGECNRVLDQELAEEEKLHKDLVSAAEERGRSAWKHLNVFRP